MIDAQAKHYNKNHKPKTYITGKKVYFNNKNIESTQPAKKLDYKYYESYKIKKLIKKQAYCLKLLPSMKIHNVFHVSLLEPYTSTNKLHNSPSSPIEVKSKKKYKVKKILNNCIHYNKLQYFVK